MLKKVIAAALSLCLIFSISVMAVSTVDETVPDAQQGAGERGRGGMPQRGEMPRGDFAPPEGFTPPEGDFTPPQDWGGFTPPQSTENNNNAETTVPETDEGVTAENPQTTENGEESGMTQGGNSPFGGQMPEGMGGFPGNTQSSQKTQAQQPTGFSGFVKTYSTPITSVILLGLAFIFVIFYRRKNY